MKTIYCTHPEPTAGGFCPDCELAVNLLPTPSCAPPSHPAFDLDIYDCPCGHMYGDHEYHYVERKMVIDHCVSCKELRNG